MELQQIPIGSRTLPSFKRAGKTTHMSKEAPRKVVAQDSKLKKKKISSENRKG
jgi:hypothetical protein